MKLSMIQICHSDPVYGVYGGGVAPYTPFSPYRSTLTGRVYGVYGENTYPYIKDVN